MPRAQGTRTQSIKRRRRVRRDAFMQRMAVQQSDKLEPVKQAVMEAVEALENVSEDVLGTTQVIQEFEQRLSELEDGEDTAVEP